MTSGAGISLAQLSALADEMAALARAGTPLDRGLMNFGREMPGAIGKLAARLAERLQRGESLDEALAAEQDSFPHVVRAVTTAGIKSGRLGEALSGVAATARSLGEARRVAVLALLYPLLVVLAASGLFAFFVWYVAPVLKDGYEGLLLPRYPLLDGIVGLKSSLPYWGPAVPLALLVAAGIWLRASGRGLLVGSAGSRRLGWVPFAGKLLRYNRVALFGETLHLLLSHDVPLPAAMRLACQTAGDEPLVAAGRRLADAWDRGERPEAVLPLVPQSFSRLLATLPVQSRLLAATRHLAEGYRWRADHQADVMRLMLPVLLTLVAGGAVTLCYALVLFVPWSHLLNQLS